MSGIQIPDSIGSIGSIHLFLTQDFQNLVEMAVFIIANASEIKTNFAWPN